MTHAHAMFKRRENVRVFHPNAVSNRSGTISAAYKKHEAIKKKEHMARE
jgi:hypothetical protein